MTAQRRRYTKAKKGEAVVKAVASSITAAAEEMGIAKSVIHYWVHSPEFAQLRTKTREEMAEGWNVLSLEAQRLLAERLPKMEDRDLIILAGLGADKGQLLSGNATARTEHRELLNDMDDHEREAMTAWLRDLAREKMAALPEPVDAG